MLDIIDMHVLIRILELAVELCVNKVFQAWRCIVYGLDSPGIEFR
jgi:hypothetical protein